MHSATTATDASVQGPYLAVYLNDHLAGSTAIVELVRRAAREHEGTELGEFLTRLGAEISRDRQALRRVMDAAGARPDCLKILAAWAAEKVGRLKLNVRLTGRSPLSPFVELEAVEVGVYGKLLLWQVLRDRRPGRGRRRPRRADPTRTASARRGRAPSPRCGRPAGRLSPAVPSPTERQRRAVARRAWPGARRRAGGSAGGPGAYSTAGGRPRGCG